MTLKKLKLIKYPNPLLTTICEPVDFDQISRILLKDLIGQMKKIMHEEKGMGISANQVGIPLKVFLIKHTTGQVQEYINSTWEAVDDGPANLAEGCLSSPGVFGIVKNRPRVIRVYYKDLDGFDHKDTLFNIDSVCFQHEWDHGEGIFWADKSNRSIRREVARKFK